MSKRTTLFGAALALMTAVGALWAVHHTNHTASDWTVFEVGARWLIHYRHQSTYSESPWRLYVENSDIQIGPPALWFISAFEQLSFVTIFNIFSILMPIIGALGIAAATRTGQLASPRAWSGKVRLTPAVAAGLLVAVQWGYYVDRWRHLDDLLALSLAAGAALLIARGRHWWLIGLLLGTGISAKPWAVVLAPILLALPRRELARATLTTIVVAIGWWGPFVIAAPDTINALGQYTIVPDPGSVLHLVGIRGEVQHWLRPVQFMLGLGVGSIVCLRRPWVAAPLAALATRVLTDPFAYGYYGMGPILFAYLYDCAGRGWRALPTFTAFTAVMEFGVPYITDNATAIGLAKLLWGVAVLAAIVLNNRTPTEEAAVRERPQASLA